MNHFVLYQCVRLTPLTEDPAPQGFSIIHATLLPFQEPRRAP
jgi:hypothetical protein